MLTSDLIRTRKLKGGKIEPLYLDTLRKDARHRAKQLIAIFSEHLGKTQGEIDRAVSDAIGHGTDFLIWRGLAKLLYDRCKFGTHAAADPQDIRRAVFEASARLGPVTTPALRQQALEEAAATLNLSPAQAEHGLYADLEDRQILQELRVMRAAALLHRYNLAQAQAVLYRATSLTIELRDRDPRRMRYLFQMLKFHRLMHAASVDAAGHTILTIDGPASVLSQSRRYGLQMAKFLPALLLTRTWTMTAQLAWEGNKPDATFVLTSREGLVSHYRARGQWVSDEEEMFEQRFAEVDAARPWRLAREGAVLTLPGGQVIVPNYTLTHEDGRVVYVEIVGFWKKEHLERRLALLEQAPWPLVLVVSERMKAERAKVAATPDRVVFYKGVILVDKVLAAAEKLTVTAPAAALPAKKATRRKKGQT
jgi:predicted nuclease of restriction endonuclease-like RecB superfamily